MPQTRRILACDGGGIRGIITLRCLEALEARVGPLHRYFDMFAGTSTGSMIAGSLAAGTPVAELIETYTARRREIYTRRPLWFLHPLVTKYQKGPMHRFLKETFKQVKLSQLYTDILITAVDTVRSETTYFSSFRTLKRKDDGTPETFGTYQDARLRDAIEASASAPTYFAAHGRFIDGGSTVYNNPAYVAAVEALRYSSEKGKPELSRYYNARLEVYSFSTGAFARRMEPYEAMQTSALGWIEYLIEESASQSGEQQSYIAQYELDIAEAAIAFYRYDLYLTPEVILQWAPPGAVVDADELTLDAVDDRRFGLMDTLGGKYAAEIFPPHWEPPAEPTPPRSSAAAAMLGRTEAAGCWNQYGRPALDEKKYVKEVLDQFDTVDRLFGPVLRA